MTFPTPRPTRRRLVAAATIALIALAVTPLLGSPPAHASTPWGACGIWTPETKLVTKYHVKRHTYYYLRCGNARYGYRHILDRHRGDFQRLAFGTHQNWRDIADLAMASISRDPDRAPAPKHGKRCLSRVIFLRNVRTNQVVRQQIIRMAVRTRDHAIISLLAHSKQC
jgi:hypothetical protein